MPAASVSWSSSGSTRADQPGPTNPEASMDTPVLSGELVVLRPVRADDADAMWDMVNDPEGRRLTGTSANFAREQVDTWCATVADREGRQDWAITRGTDEYLGEIVLNEIDRHDSN